MVLALQHVEDPVGHMLPGDLLVSQLSVSFLVVAAHCEGLDRVEACLLVSTAAAFLAEFVFADGFFLFVVIVVANRGRT